MEPFDKNYRSADEIRGSISEKINNIQPQKQPVNDVWASAIRNQQEEARRENGMRHIQQMEAIDRQRQLQQLQQHSDAQDLVAATMAIAKRDGGRVSPEVLRYVNDSLGYDGQSLGVMDAGYANDGNFFMKVGQRDAQGNTAYHNKVIPQTAQLGLLANYPGLFSDNDRMAFREGLKTKYSPEELDAFERFGRAAQERLQGRISALKNDLSRNNGKLSVDDRLAIEREKNKGKIDVESARGQNRIDLANLTGEQKKELQNSINAMKKYGIDVTSAVRMAIGGNRTKNVPFNDKVFTYYSNRLDVLNSKGTLTAAEQKERDKAQRIVDGMTNGVMGIEEKQETPDWMSAFASGDAANTAKPQNREGQKSAQNAQMQKPSKTKAAQATAAQKQTAAPQGEQQTTKGQTLSTKPPEQKRETTKLTPAEQSVGRDAVAMFKKIHPDITDVDDNPEKYDKQLTSIAQSLSGDYNYRSNSTLQKERDRKAAQDKRLQQTAAEQESLRKQTLANLNGRDKAVYQKAMELYAPLYERAKLQAREDHGGDYEESVRKKFAEYVKEYNAEHGLKFVDGLSRPDRQVFGDYHVADLLSDVFGNDAGKYLGPVGSRGNSQLRLQSHGKNK